MKFVKDPESDREDYILQKDKGTKGTATLIVVILIGLIIAVAITGLFIGD